MTVDGGEEGGGDRSPESLFKRLTRRRRYRSGFQMAVDGAAWAVALYAATLLRYDFQTAQLDYGGLLVLIPAAIVVQALAGLVCGLYTGRARSAASTRSWPWSDRS